MSKCDIERVNEIANKVEDDNKYHGTVFPFIHIDSDIRVKSLNKVSEKLIDSTKTKYYG